MDEILIYSPKLTSRVRYTFRLVFKELLRIKVSFTSVVDEFQSSDLPKIIYGEKQISDDIFFKSSGLLFEKGVNDIDLEPFDYEGMRVIFPVYDKFSALPFDVFSAIFYFVARYEEYQPYKVDKHGRFTAHLSTAYKLGILEKPVANIWSIMVKQVLLEKYPEIKFKQLQFKFVPTYDIDSAYSYAQKGLIRSIGGLILSIKRFEWQDILERLQVLFTRHKDPFDTFDLQISYQKKYGLRPVYFILFGRYGQFNKNINTRNKTFRFLIKMLSDYARIGIHPSYYSVEDDSLLPLEKKNLENAINKNVNCSRQHFLRLNLPSTYRHLINNDITDDYSMGFAAQPGFRAGICSSYNFYDIDFEAETNFRIHPFAVMDGTLKDYLDMTPADAITKINQLIEEVRRVNGTFISLWHNESLSDKKRWSGWRRVYEQLLEKAVD
ncbi:MAG: hypothetical protein C0598_04715 [Marinilabiliales bacterium]|nr:MAG: hypothetical protein C0598_04715 [Marinilabiliales bacterium]